MANWVNYRSKVRFSCFNSIIHYHRSKKEVQRTAESMSKASEDFSQHQGLKASVVPSSLNPLSLKANYGDPSATSVEEDTSFTFDHCRKSEDSHSGSSPEANTEVHHKAQLKKSQSLGSALNRSGRVFSVIDSEDEIDQEFSCDHIDENSYAKLVDVLDHSGVGEPIGSKIPTSILLNQDVKVVVSESSQGNRMVCSESIFSIENTRQLEEGVGDTINHVPCRYLDDFGHRTPSTPPKIARSCSLPHIGVLSPTSKDGSRCQVYLGGRCKSSEDLNALCEKRKAFQNSVLGYHAVEEQDRDTGMLENSKSKYEIHPGDGYESYEHVHYEKDWRVPGMDEEGLIEKCEGESSVQNWNELPSKDFKTKRIAEWVNKIDLEESISLEDPSIFPTSIDRVKRSYVSGSTSTAKLDSKITHGMEAAKNYVSSLPATSISAQLANLGLVVVPFLSAFVTLKTLNLSGNSIVRITSGALPRGLHVLNLAKNNISTVEGLRELTRLRVLDLSYNRLIRIGHGLASCSSLKELYLAGNKISEVEGLHRLLKLNIVDLRFNKISTAKCLGQLAANYSSLQAINLEGNPAQRNVGDEQLKKYLQSILPHLMYFNRQTIRASSSKEVTDRSARSAIASHQLDRGVRSENKLIRKGSHTLSTGKASSSSNHGSRVQAVFSSKQSKDRHGRLPPAGTKGSHRHHYLDFGSKLFSLRPDLSMRRSQSEGHLGSS